LVSAVSPAFYQARPEPPVFSMKHGFFTKPFELSIIAPDPAASVYYTTDGSKPGQGNGTLYNSPVTVSSTSVIRAASFKNNLWSDKVVTSTYLFPGDIIYQPDAPNGYPSQWGPYTAIPGIAPADYEMDPELTSDPLFAERLKQSLCSLPVMSVVTERSNLFSSSQDPDTGGIYIYTGPPLTNTTNGTGLGWERPASVEYFDTRDSVSFQVDCAIQIHGGHSRRPEKSPKHSFRLEFKESFGPDSLFFPLFGDRFTSTFKAIILRAGFNNSWVHHTSSERLMAQYIQDIWSKDTHLEMGYNSSASIYIHLFINGLYWGIYSPSEKLDKDYAETYLYGDKEDFDIIKDYAEVVDGNISAWNKLVAKANAGLASNSAYQYIQGKDPDGTINASYDAMVDVISLADYMLLNFYAGNSDWDHHNWVAIRNRVNQGTGFRFFCWDEEKILEDFNVNILSENNNNCPSRIFQKLLQNADFRRLFADRIQKHCFGGGALTAGKSLERWLKRSAQVEGAILAESARWGDYRRDVHKWQVAGPFDLYTYDNHWLQAKNFIVNEYFPKRTDIFISQLRNAGLFPQTDAPIFTINGKPVNGEIVQEGDTLRMQAASGLIYYTTDGRDPVNWNPVPSVKPLSNLYTKEIIIGESSCFRARVSENDQWSAATEHYFVIPSDFRDIRITEIHYNPVNQVFIDGRELEFIELKNTGMATLNLKGCRFFSGIEFGFDGDVIFGPGDFIVLTSNSREFQKQYGFSPGGEYNGQLSNTGERIGMVTFYGDTLCLLTYDDDTGWPELPDGEGSSLVPGEINPSFNQDDPFLWRSSHHAGGSPGADDIFRSDLIEGGTIGSGFSLFQNFPNPVHGKTFIPYRLEEESNVEISLYTNRGTPVMILEKGTKPSGDYLIEWNGADGSGRDLTGGTYYYRITVLNSRGENSLAKKMILLR
jgi:hypothetical protein